MGSDIDIPGVGPNENVTVANNKIENTTGFGLEVDATGVPAGEAVLAPGNWWGSADLAVVQAEIEGAVIYNTFRASGVDAAPATPGFQPAGALISTLVVTTIADEDDAGATTEAPGGLGLSLREALALANANADADTISFEAGLTGTLTLVNGQLTISSSVSIAGGDVVGITIDAAGSSRVFNVTAGTSTLEGLVITGGSSSDGGGILNQATLSRSTRRLRETTRPKTAAASATKAPLRC